jgi:mono/diheme cytochrome c family protein
MSSERRPASRRLCVSTALAVFAALAAIALAGCNELFAKSPGERLWRKHCAECHGLDGSGNTPGYLGEVYADLLDNTWRTATPDRGSIDALVREGVFGKMPAFDQLSREEMRDLLDYLGELRGERF